MIGTAAHEPHGPGFLTRMAYAPEAVSPGIVTVKDPEEMAVGTNVTVYPGAERVTTDVTRKPVPVKVKGDPAGMPRPAVVLVIVKGVAVHGFVACAVVKVPMKIFGPLGQGLHLLTG